MSSLTTLELTIRLVMATVAIIGPTILYFGLWRFLMWLRDDQLIEVLAQEGVIEDPQPSAADLLASTSGGSPNNRCSQCDTVNVPGAPICRNCMQDLE